MLNSKMTALLLAGYLAACASEPVAPEIEYEGDDPQECSDGVDNDRNGYFDCDDKACWGSPICQDGSSEASTGAGTSGTGGQGGGQASSSNGAGGSTAGPSGGGTTTAVAGHLKGVTLSYTVTYDLDQFGDALCDPSVANSEKVCDCHATYEGTGTQLEAEGQRVTMEGTWKVASTTCGDAFLNGVWVGDDELSHHSFYFDAALSELQTWVVHADAQNFDPILVSPKSQKQFWISGMTASWDDAAKFAEHTEQEQQYLDIIQVTVDHEVAFSFTE